MLPDLGGAVTQGLESHQALDIVETAIRALEDAPELNAGYGAVLDLEGNISLDAGIADGWSGCVGAIAGATVANPIVVARRVLDKTPHVMLIGNGAAQLGRDLSEVKVAPERRKEWERAKAEGALDPTRYGRTEKVDTVGAVARDDDGHLAAGSSTGGVFGKMPGRVGDAPVFGAGFYASKKAAVVGTGVGELFLETLASARAGILIENGGHPADAVRIVIEALGERSEAPAGLLAIDSEGRAGAAYRGASMSVFGPEGRVKPVRLP